MTYRKSIRNILKATIITFSLLILTVSCLADETEPIFTVDFPTFYSSIATTDKTTAEVTTDFVEDGVKCLKITPNTASSSSDDIVLDTYINIKDNPFGFASGADFAKAKYAAVKYKYVCPEGASASAREMKISIMRNGGILATSANINASNSPVKNEWTYAYFDLLDVSTNVLEDGIFRQIHITPFGAGVKPGKISDGEVFYIAEVLFYAEKPSAMTDTEKTTESLDEPKSIFKVDFMKVSNGIVDNKNTAEVIKDHVENGITCLKVVPNRVNPGANEITLDSYGAFASGETLAKAKYVAIKYKYICPDGAGSAKRMTMRIMKNGGILEKSSSFVAMNDSVKNQWSYAYFNISDISEKIVESGTFKQIHLLPFGSGVAPTSLSEGECMCISDILFCSENPNADASFNVSLKSSDPLATGAHNGFEIKSGEEYTLPENPYVLDNSIFVGWKSSKDGEIYDAGATLFGEEEDVVYTAQFKQVINTPDIRVIPLSVYNNGIVDNRDTAIIENTELDGVSCIKIKPNSETLTPDEPVNVDTFFSQSKDGIDIGAYSYAMIRYYIDGELPKETDFTIRVMKNGNILTASTYCPSEKNIVTGKWDFAVFDLSPAKANLSPEMEEHLLKQIHIIPINNTKAGELTGDISIYLENLILFKDKPEFVIHESYIKGYDGGFFRPGNTMTRAEAATIVARLSAGGDEKVPLDCTSAFADVSKDSWYYKYVSYIESLGLLSSYGVSFLPDNAITRAEFVELVFKMGLLTDNGKNGNFTDVAVDHPRAKVITAAGKAGLVNGYDNGDGTFSFHPDNTITRAEVVTVINNAYQRNITKEALSSDIKYSFNDVSTEFWAYPNIMEASLTHAEYNGTWISALVNPKSLVGGPERADTEKGSAYLAEVDKLANDRIAEIRNTESTVNVTGTKYYVSNSGNDANDGKTPETAWKTINKVNSASLSVGDGVFFKRGDIFRERLKAKAGVTYSAYGIGEKPQLIGSPENAADPSCWTLLEGSECIWVYKEKLLDVGLIVFNDGEAVGLKEIPDWYNGAYYVRGSKGTVPFVISDELNNNLDFFCDISSDTITTPATVYLRCNEGNPGEIYDSIELATRNDIITVNADNVTIDNLCIKYGGSHGIGGGTKKNFTVSNCEIGWIGGSIQKHYSDRFGQAVRLGNGVEIYGGCDGYTVDNCYIYQCYDAGVTHQRSGGGTEDISMYNITYSNNVIEKCVYSIEYFNDKGENDAVKRDGKNYRIVGNILRLCGYGWGQQRTNLGVSSHIQGGTSRNEYEKGTYVIENNIFDRGRDSLVRSGTEHTVWAPVYSGNTYIQTIGLPLGRSAGTQTYVYDYVVDVTIKEVLGDNDAKVYWLK